MQHKIGMHWINVHGRPVDVDYLRALRPLSVKLVAGDVPDVQWIADTYAAAPESVIVLRSHAMSEQKADMASAPVATGIRHAREWRGHIDRLRAQAAERGLVFPSNLVVLGINEPEVWHHLQATVEYTVAFLDECTRLGLKAGALSLSVGWPANSGPDTLPDWTPYAAIEPALRRNGGFLFIHEYHDLLGPSENWGWWCGRYMACPWDVPIIIGEYGIDRYVKDPNAHPRGWQGNLPADQVVAQIADYHERVLLDPRIHSVQIYTSDYSHPWGSFDLMPAYPALLRYVDDVRARASAVQTWTGYVTAVDGLNLRAAPNRSATVLQALPQGTVLTVRSPKGNDWLEVLYNGTLGYVAGAYVGDQAPVVDKPSDKAFDRAMAFVFAWEDGLSEHPSDPGGLTKYGISKRAYPNLDIANLTKEQARQIFYRDYWLATGCDKVGADLALVLFDSAVNCGAWQARLWLTASDGNLYEYLYLRLSFYTQLETWKTFGLGWTRRVAALLRELG